MTNFKTKLMASALGIASVATPVAMTISTYAATSSSSVSATGSLGQALRRATGRSASSNDKFRFVVEEDQNNARITYSFFTDSVGASTQYTTKSIDDTTTMAVLIFKSVARVNEADPSTYINKAQQVKENGGSIKYEGTVYPDNSVYGTVEMQTKQGQRSCYSFSVK